MTNQVINKELTKMFEASLDKQWLAAEHGISFVWDESSKNIDMHRYKDTRAWFMYQSFCAGYHAG